MIRCVIDLMVKGIFNRFIKDCIEMLRKGTKLFPRLLHLIDIQVSDYPERLIEPAPYLLGDLVQLHSPVPLLRFNCWLPKSRERVDAERGACLHSREGEPQKEPP